MLHISVSISIDDTVEEVAEGRASAETLVMRILDGIKGTISKRKKAIDTLKREAIVFPSFQGTRFAGSFTISQDDAEKKHV
jgi:hypothetical protein